MKKIIAAVVLSALCLPAMAVENAVLSFYQRQAVSKGTTSKQDRAFAAALARDVAEWVRINPQDPEVKTALLMQADYYLRAREEANALLALYKVRFYFPSDSDVTLLSSNIEVAMEELNRSEKGQALKLLAVDTGTLPSLDQRKAALLENLVKADLSKIYQPVCELFEDFFAQYPRYNHTDKLTLLYGDWHRQNGNFLAAVTEYKKVNELMAQTTYKAASLRMTADVYASDLKEYETAMTLYNQVLKQYPNSSERGIVYKHMAVLEENQKNYASSITYYGKAIADLGMQNIAYDAWTGKADVLIKTKQYQAAYDTLLQGAAVFSREEEKYVTLLSRAAEVAARKMKDPVQQATALDQALLTYPQTQRAPQMMYELAQAYERADKPLQALAVYKRLILQFPTDKYASKAQGRVNKLEK